MNRQIKASAIIPRSNSSVFVLSFLQRERKINEGPTTIKQWKLSLQTMLKGLTYDKVNIKYKKDTCSLFTYYLVFASSGSSSVKGNRSESQECFKLCCTCVVRDGNVVQNRRQPAVCSRRRNTCVHSPITEVQGPSCCVLL